MSKRICDKTHVESSILIRYIYSNYICICIEPEIRPRWEKRKDQDKRKSLRSIGLRPPNTSDKLFNRYVGGRDRQKLI